MMKKALIAAPFGNYLHFDWATSVHGTFTFDARPGRIAQMLKTIRPTRHGWVNRMGLRNPGIRSQLTKIEERGEDFIWSISHTSNTDEWSQLFNILPCKHRLTVELNISCPAIQNVLVQNIPTMRRSILRKYVRDCKMVIMKLPGDTERALNAFEIGYNANVRVFHFCNTIPVVGGGESGRRLQAITLPLIERIKREYGDSVTCIGGGGIYSSDDVKRYRDVGTDHFSIGTACFTPWKLFGIKREIYK